MERSSNIASWEELGRGVYSSKYARRSRNGRIPVKVFLERLGETRVSVDRLTIAPTNEAIAIASARAIGRDGTFRGWAVVNVEGATGSGRTIVASPIFDENPYHADIVLSQSETIDREEQTRHAQELADASRWREVSNLV